MKNKIIQRMLSALAALFSASAFLIACPHMLPPDVPPPLPSDAIVNIEDPAAYATARRAVEAGITGRAFHLDAETGNDETGDGSAAQPWKSLSKALAYIQPGDGVYLAGGDYGPLACELPNPGPGLITFLCEEGTLPSIGPVRISTNGVTLWGLRIFTTEAEQSLDPYLIDAGSGTYNHTASPLELVGAEGISILNCNIYGMNKYLTDYGINSRAGCSKIRLSWCEVTRCRRAFNCTDTLDAIISYNHFHGIAGSAVYIGYGCAAGPFLVEGNHIHDSNYEFTDPWCPRAAGQNYHGAGVSIRCSNISIRNNIIHDGFNSAGIYSYLEGGVTRFDNILIENNILYDIRGPYVTRFEGLGDNIVLKNNLLVGHGRISNDVSSRFDTTLLIGAANGLAAEEDASGISFRGNISLGRVNLGPASLTATIHDNIVYVLVAGDGTETTQNQADAAKIHSKMVSWDYGGEDRSLYFKSGFFASSNLTFAWDPDENGDDLWSNGNGNPKGHHQLLDFNYAPGNTDVLAWASQNAADYPPDYLGSLGDSGFIAVNEKNRAQANVYRVGPF